jgi:glyoxylase-like metal-dependent hydrolase (beta-lactamase superfamily II)
MAMVIDPKYDVDTYIKMTTLLALKIEGIIETHIHADHISGARKLQRLTDAPIYMFEDSKVKFNFVPLKEGNSLKIGNARLEVLHTPGHTPESTSLVYYDDKRNPNIPSTVFTGDTLFVGDVGRSDLSGMDTSLELYESLTEKILRLPDFVELMPAHYAGSACGAGMSPKISSTLGYERLSNPLLRAESFSDFRKKIGNVQLPPLPEKEKIRQLNAGVD